MSEVPLYPHDSATLQHKSRPQNLAQAERVRAILGSCLGFTFRVSSFGFHVSGFGLRASGEVTFGDEQLEVSISGFEFRILDFRFRVSDFRFRVSNCGFRFQLLSKMSNSEFRVSGFGGT